ncbi:MAG: AAA family ATPase [Oscillospiraceae bacterium]|nr:AAA family ATPase [Oscillospiraceae bacterium]
MLKRKIYDELLRWKSLDNKLCLLVKGARQVGKTFIIELFARENYKHFTFINFAQNPTYKTIFERDLDVETIIKQISLRVPDAELVPGETVIFLDEIQDCTRARAALKFLTQDGRFDVIASGSMLGINYKDVPSYPVGYVDRC